MLNRLFRVLSFAFVPLASTLVTTASHAAEEAVGDHAPAVVVRAPESHDTMGLSLFLVEKQARLELGFEHRFGELVFLKGGFYGELEDGDYAPDLVIGVVTDGVLALEAQAGLAVPLSDDTLSVAPIGLVGLRLQPRAAGWMARLDAGVIDGPAVSMTLGWRL